jgi:hypothetical protein
MTTPTELIERLASHDADARKAAADELYGLRDAAVAPMIDAVRVLGPSPQYALLADTLRRLGQVSFSAVREALAAAQTREERRTFGSIFCHLGKSALPDYICALHDCCAEIRLGSIGGIGYLGEAGLPAAPAIASLLGEDDEKVRAAATRALVMIGAGVVPLLQEIRATGPGRARPAALRCLADVGGESAFSSRDRRALERLIRIKLIDDHPMPITGCFLSWIAVEACDQRQVMDFFGLTPAWPATFALGIEAADADGHRHDDETGHLARVFVTPPVDGWTLLVGPWCSPIAEDRRDEILDLCVRASATFGKAQAYWHGEQGDGSAWLVAENGTLIRRGANIGEALDEEIGLGAPLPYEAETLATEKAEDERRYALFDFAPALAGRLSVNPRELSTATTWQGHGWLALTPAGVMSGAPAGALKFLLGRNSAKPPALTRPGVSPTGGRSSRPRATGAGRRSRRCYRRGQREQNARIKLHGRSREEAFLAITSSDCQRSA